MVGKNDRDSEIAARRRIRVTRVSRVEQLARQVAAGEYHVDAHQLADVLLERARFHRRVRRDLVAERHRVEA
jgi:anti-sigma28 factor (negative regulator of flagellin synthesis)